MLNRLLDDCFLSELDTKVIEVMEENHRYWHALNETIFFQEGGGMTSDEGMIDHHPVLGLKKEKGMFWHLLDIKLSGVVHLSVNMHERFRKCQIHTAQHLISALVNNVNHCEVLAHHVSDEQNDIEFNLKSFHDKQINELQMLCNGLIRDDLPVRIIYPTKEEAMQYASLKRLDHDLLRVVKIGNLDYNPCGCMHVPSLRYIQSIMIMGYEKTTKGYKIIYQAGDQILENMKKRYIVLDEASKALALPHLYINTGIYKMSHEIRALTGDVVVWKNKYYQLGAKELVKQEGRIIFYEFDDMDMKSLSQYARYLIEHYERIVVFVAKIYDKAQVVVAVHENLPEQANDLFNQIASRFHLQGGGNKRIAQGSRTWDKNLLEDIKALLTDKKI